MSAPPRRDLLEDLKQDYRIVLLRFLRAGDETARVAGYDLGRRAFGQAVSLLEICRIHHEVAHRLLAEAPAEDRLAVDERTGQLLLEVLAAYDMTHRRVLDQTAGPGSEPDAPTRVT